ncbi:MAG TPA: alcohol dehydrogenase catalytic domain-containing protein, partial [Terricaulis sp.]|nr:alcohol dehydrogenase catalytic domain-containing protein [Terricaulis sp.]
MKAIQFATLGGPEVLQLVDAPTPTLGAHDVLVRHHAIGVNFIDTYFRSGLYKTPLPAFSGQEGAGLVEAVGESVTRFKIGDRIAYCMGPSGAYAELHAVNETRAV